MLRDDTGSEGPGDRSLHDVLGNVVPGPSDIYEILRNKQVLRRFYIRNQNQLKNRIGGLARWQLGWRLDLPEKERDAITTKALTMIKEMRAGDVSGPEKENLWPHLVIVDRALEPFETPREEITESMMELARQTPGMAVINQTLGVTELGLAVILGEAGNPSEYPNIQKFWKYLGWAPEEKYPKGEKREGRKVPRRRKGEVYGVIVPCLIQAQTRIVRDKNGKDTGRRIARGPEGELYLERKAMYLARFIEEGRKNPKADAEKLALRVMLKAFLAKIWACFPAKDGSPRKYTGNHA